MPSSISSAPVRTLVVSLLPLSVLFDGFFGGFEAGPTELNELDELCELDELDELDESDELDELDGYGGFTLVAKAVTESITAAAQRASKTAAILFLGLALFSVPLLEEIFLFSIKPPCFCSTAFLLPQQDIFPLPAI